MANTKITDLTLATAATGDELPINDITDTSDKKITVGGIVDTITGDITVNSSAVSALGANVVDSSELVDGSVDLSHMSANSIDSDQYVDASIDNIHLAGSIAASKLIGTDIATVGTITTGTWSATDVAVAAGGTGASTAQAAINTLTAVSGATDEHVLTKDTATGDATFKVSASGADNMGNHTATETLKMVDQDILAVPTDHTDFFTIDVEVIAGDDGVGETEPMFHVNLRRDTPAALSNRNLFEISNNDVAQLTMLNNGNVDFEGNDILDINDITSITSLNGVAIGNYILTTDNTFDTAGTGLTSTGSTVNAIGTASRISVSANAIDIDSAYVGQATITTLGTIATGTWEGTTVAVLQGGTGVTTSTGTTNVVLSGSPTIVTPTIASFTNATHSHLNAAGGGTITVPAFSGTSAEFNTANTDDSFAYLGDAQTFTATQTINPGDLKVIDDPISTITMQSSKDPPVANATLGFLDFKALDAAAGTQSFYGRLAAVTKTIGVGAFTGQFQFKCASDPSAGLDTYFALIGNAGSTGEFQISKDTDFNAAAIKLDGTERIHLDGSFSGDTYIHEASANVFEIVEGGNVITMPAVSGADTLAALGTAQTFSADQTFSGAVLTTAGTMRIPLSATPTMAVDGDFAIDTTITDFSHGLIRYFDGEEVVVVAVPTAQIVTPTDGHVISYNGTNNEFELVAAGAADNLGNHTATTTLLMVDQDINAASAGSTDPFLIQNEVADVDDSGATAIITLNSKTVTGAVANRDLFDIQENGTPIFAITNAGVIDVGTWQGTAVASAFLDADTAHLTGTQTFSGAKTFSADVTLTGAGTDLIIPSGSRVRFDGSAAGDTYIEEVSANDLQIVCGGASMVRFHQVGAASEIHFRKDIIMDATEKVRLDGLAAGDTHIAESAANVIDITVGGSIIAQLDSTGLDVQTGTVQEGGVDISPIGVHDIWVGAASMWDIATAGCAALARTELVTNDINIQTLDFDTTTEEHCQFSIALPRNYDNGTVTATFYWSNTAGLATETVDWAISGGALSDNDAIDTALGAEITTTDTFLAQNDMHISAESTAITIAGTPADNDMIQFQIARKVATDNLTGDAQLIGIKLHITTDAATAA